LTSTGDALSSIELSAGELLSEGALLSPATSGDASPEGCAGEHADASAAIERSAANERIAMREYFMGKTLTRAGILCNVTNESQWWRRELPGAR
jgi:hypothetical protein